jgi:hypothetical protein
MDDETKKMYTENAEFAAANLLIVQVLFAALCMQPGIDRKKLWTATRIGLKGLIEANDKPNVKALLSQFMKFVEGDH